MADSEKWLGLDNGDWPVHVKQGERMKENWSRRINLVIRRSALGKSSMKRLVVGIGEITDWAPGGELVF
jgi:hypothetical protein